MSEWKGGKTVERRAETEVLLEKGGRYQKLAGEYLLATRRMTSEASEGATV